MSKFWKVDHSISLSSIVAVRNENSLVCFLPLTILLWLVLFGYEFLLNENYTKNIYDRVTIKPFFCICKRCMFYMVKMEDTNRKRVFAVYILVYKVHVYIYVYIYICIAHILLWGVFLL